MTKKELERENVREKTKMDYEIKEYRVNYCLIGRRGRLIEETYFCCTEEAAIDFARLISNRFDFFNVNIEQVRVMIFDL